MLAKLFTKDPMNLRGPNVGKAPDTTFSLSGSKLQFKCPPQTANMPGIFNGDDFDFERDTKTEIGDPHHRHLAAFRTGWDFEDGWWRGMTYGGLTMGVYITHNSWRNNPEDSLFIPSNLVQQSLQIERIGFIRRSASEAKVDDHRISNDDIETKRFCNLIHPESDQDIQLTSINNITWACFETFYPGGTPDIYFQAAVEHNNMVRFIFSQDAFGGIDFFGPDHNLKEACHNLIHEIMNTVTLELSPRAQKQKDDVIERYGANEVV